MRTPADTSVRVESDGNFCDFRLQKRSLDDHLHSEFHPGASHVEPLIKLFGKPSEATIDIVNRGTKPESRQKAEHRIPQPSVKERHRVHHDLSASGGKTTTLNNFVSFAQLLQKSIKGRKIVAIVRVSHDDEPALCVGNPSHQSVAIPSLRNGDHPGTTGRRNFGGTVGAPIVGDNHFPL